MKLSEILRLVWINLIQNKFKVVLTSIGIVVGAATIVMVIANRKRRSDGCCRPVQKSETPELLIFHMSNRQTVHRQIVRVLQNQAQQINHQEEIVSPKETRETPADLEADRECRRCPEVHRAEAVRECHRCQEAVCKAVSADLWQGEITIMTVQK